MGNTGPFRRGRQHRATPGVWFRLRAVRFDRSPQRHLPGPGRTFRQSTQISLDLLGRKKRREQNGLPPDPVTKLLNRNKFRSIFTISRICERTPLFKREFVFSVNGSLVLQLTVASVKNTEAEYNGATNWEVNMKCNMGKTDRTVRVLLGLVIIVLGLVFHSWWGALGIIPLFTAAIRWCPLYVPFRISTCEAEKNPE